MKSLSLMYHKGGFVKAGRNDLHRVLAIPFRAMKGGRRSMPVQDVSGDTDYWVLEILSGLAWMG